MKNIKEDNKLNIKDTNTKMEDIAKTNMQHKNNSTETSTINNDNILETNKIENLITTQNTKERFIHFESPNKYQLLANDEIDDNMNISNFIDEEDNDDEILTDEEETWRTTNNGKNDSTLDEDGALNTSNNQETIPQRLGKKKHHDKRGSNHQARTLRGNVNDNDFKNKLPPIILYKIKVKELVAILEESIEKNEFIFKNLSNEKIVLSLSSLKKF